MYVKREGGGDNGRVDVHACMQKLRKYENIFTFVVYALDTEMPKEDTRLCTSCNL